MSKQTVKLGIMPPLTGLVGIYGMEISRAAQIACDEVNENGGVLGKPLELIIEDDGSLPDSAVAAAFKLVDQHHCSAIIGNLLSNSRIAVAYQVAEPRKIPLLNFSFYEGSILSRYFFHFAALPNQQIDKMIPYMRERYGPKMFFAGNNYEWPRGSIDAAKRALLKAGGEIVGEKYCPIGTPLDEIEHLLDAIEEAAPDVFVPYFAGADQINLLTRFTERGLKNKIAVVMGHYDEIMASILPSSVREDFYSSNTYFMTIDTEANNKYKNSLSKLPGVNGIWPHGNGILTNFGEGAYLCVKAFAQAANAAGSLDSEALVEILQNIQVSSPQGTVQMDPVTHHASVNTYLSRCNEDGEFTIIEKFGMNPPIMPERYNHQRINNQATLEDDIRLQARILEQMSEAVLLVDSSTNTIVYTNLGAEMMFGYEKRELIGQSIGLLYDLDDTNEDNMHLHPFSILNEKGTWKGELKNVKKDGTAIWCSADFSTFTHPVHGEVWLGVQRDITQQKEMKQVLLRQEALRESEKRSRTIIDASPVPLVINDKYGNITFINNAFINTLGYTLDEIPTLEDWWPRAYPDEEYRQWVIKSWQQNLNDMLSSYNRFVPLEIDIRCKDDYTKTFLVSASLLDEGVSEDYLISLFDISEQKQNELALISARNEAESANRAKSLFLANMSHEIRTPMNAVLGFSELLEKSEDLNMAQISYLKSIKSGAKSLLQIINDILDLSKIEAGMLTIDNKEFDMGALIEEIKSVFQPVIFDKNLQFNLHYPSDMPNIWVLDEVRLRQILFNLLSNAIKFTDKGIISLEIHVHQIDQEERIANITLIVTDTGIGIAAHEQDKIFNNFEQSDQQDNRKYGGTGLGLAISEKLATAMDGKISVESELGRGSRFKIHFPALKFDYSKVINKNDEQDVHYDFSNAKILSVDDVDLNLMLVRARLDPYPFEIIEAMNGIEALEQLAIHKVDLILLDLQMPVMDGYTLKKKLMEHESYKKIPVIALTAAVLESDQEKLEGLGFDMLLTKPLSNASLLNALTHFIPYSKQVMDSD
ncbi:MAG: ABC transporter substrate-binding protein [Sulfuricurvum sp.]|nr:ABC transporter substrate-binding protein [Sulfuricurvum sp.]